MSDQHNPYEDACEAYEKALEKQGYNCGFVEDDAAFEDAHAVAIGEAVQAAVKAERERVLAEFAALAASWREAKLVADLDEDDDLGSEETFETCADETVELIAKLREESGT
jgi:hypothetical protein